MYLPWVLLSGIITYHYLAEETRDRLKAETKKAWGDMRRAKKKFTRKKRG